MCARFAARIGATLTYPPTPTATSAPFTSDEHANVDRAAITGAFAARMDTSRRNGAAATPSKRYPAAGMRFASWPSREPMNRTCAP